MDTKTKNDAETMMSHTVLLSGIVFSMPKDQQKQVSAFVNAIFEDKLKKELSRDEPRDSVVEMIKEAKEKTLRLIP
ncbi:TPA: hypothetical protein KE767_004357 [Citrobacter koseri]|nr:hypothetical protein [Citrobacter koseri]